MKKIAFHAAFAIAFLLANIQSAFCQSQQGMVDKRGGGQTFDAEQYKIDRMKTQLQVNLNPNKYAQPNELKKPEKKANDKGQIWIDGYCRYRPAENITSHYSTQSETAYLNAVYPKDTVRYSDNFSGKGNINWDGYKKDLYKTDEACANLKKLVSDNVNDGIPLPVFNQLLKCSSFFDDTEINGMYQFSKAEKIWIKRMSGPEKMSLEINAQFNYTNGDDQVVLLINDKGDFDLTDRCTNCEHTKNKLKSGNAKSWVDGGWNEIAIAKDEFNTVRILVNDELIYQYQEPNIPITTRYASLSVSLPYKWEKEKLMYNVGQFSVEAYPKKF